MAQVMGLPGEDEQEYAKIERRRQLANMLAGDAMSPIQNMGTGAYASPISPFQGLQKILAGYLAGTGMRDADKAQRDVIEGRSRKIDSAFDYLEQLRKPGAGALTQQGQAYEPSPITRNPVQGIAPLTRQEMDDVTGADYAGLRKPVPPVDLPGVFNLGPNVAKTMGIPLREATLEDVGGVIRAPEVGVTTSQGGADAGGAPRVLAPETPDAYMAKVRIAARKAGLPAQVFLDNAPDVKATYERLLAEEKDKRDFLRQSDLETIKQQNAIALEAIQSGRVKNVTVLEDGRVVMTDGQGKEVATINGPAKFRTVTSGAGYDAKGNPQTVDKQISFIDGKPTAVDIPGVSPQSRAPLATVNNTVNPLEKAERTEQGKANVKMVMDEYRTQAETARKMNGHVQTMTDVINRGDFKTGFAGPTRAAVNSFFAFMGSPEAARRATDAESFQSAAMEVVLQKQQMQKGPQTDKDFLRIQDTGAKLSGTPQANRFILSVAKANNDRDIARYNFFRNWYSKHNGSYEGAESAWYGEGPGDGVPDAGRGGRSLFDEPALSMYRSGRVEEGPKGGGVGTNLTPAEQKELQELERKYGGKK